MLQYPGISKLRTQPKNSHQGEKWWKMNVGKKGTSSGYLKNNLSGQGFIPIIPGYAAQICCEPPTTYVLKDKSYPPTPHTHIHTPWEQYKGVNVIC